MARPLRFIVDNGIYHVLSRGHNRRQIFHDEDDFTKYLEILLKSKEKYDLKLYHYALMTNHIHLIIMVPQSANLSNAMRDLNQTYAQCYRMKYGGVGYVWQGRFKSFLIQNGVYLLQCGRYIEINPVVAGLVKNPEDYRWSSCGNYISGKRDKLVDMDPEFLSLSENLEDRKKIYEEFLKDGLKEKRSIERYFKAGAYGDENFIGILKQRGLKQVTWKVGRPGK